MSTLLIAVALCAWSIFFTGCESEEETSDQSSEMSAAGEETSQAGEDTPQAGEDTPQAGEDTPQAGEDTPQAGEDTPQAGEDAPQAGEDTPQAGEDAPQAGEDTPQAGDAIEAGTDDPTAGDDIIIDVAGTEAGEMAEEWMDPEDFGEPGQGAHAFTMTDINGEEVDMRRYRGRVALIVNVASRCGYTGQYEGLQELYDAYRDRGLVVLGFPANNFGNQEPGSEEEIAEFCSSNYGVNFPMFAKISVKGADIDPLYQYLTGESGREVSWNFNKFLVNEDGVYVEQFLSQAEPMGPEITAALEELLPAE